MRQHLTNSLATFFAPERWLTRHPNGAAGGPPMREVGDATWSAGATARGLIARQVPAYAGLLMTFMLLVSLHPEEAFAGLFLLPIFLAGRSGIRAGLLAAVFAAVLELMVVEATHGQVLRTGSWPYILTTWTLFIGAGAFSGALFRYLAFLELRARNVELARAAEDAALAEIGRVISSSPDIHLVYPRFGAAVSKLIPFDRITISLTDPERGLFTVALQPGSRLMASRRGRSFLWKAR